MSHDDRSALERRHRAAGRAAGLVDGRLDRDVQTVGVLVHVEHPTVRIADHDRGHPIRVGDEVVGVRRAAAVHPERLRRHVPGVESRPPTPVRSEVHVWRVHGGKVISTIKPPLGRACVTTSAPWAAAIALTMERPKP